VRDVMCDVTDYACAAKLRYDKNRRKGCHRTSCNCMQSVRTMKPAPRQSFWCRFVQNFLSYHLFFFSSFYI